MQQKTDILIVGGTVVTMDESCRVLEDAGLAIEGDRILAVGTREELESTYQATRVINARGKVIMPGLVDTYGHAGHGLIRGIYNPVHGWPSERLYWHYTTDQWWYAEALLAATERLRFGVTTGASIIGATPARVDSPIFGVRNAEAYAKVGIRTALGVGPPDPFVPHLQRPWRGGFLEDRGWVEKPFTYEETIRNCTQIIEGYHKSVDGRIHIALAPPYLFGRHTYRDPQDFSYYYAPEDVPIMIEKAEQIRALADQYEVQIHTHMFMGAVDFAIDHFGRERVERLLGPDLVIAHGNGLKESEVEVIGAARCSVATAPSTGENIWFGFAPMVELLDAGANVTISTDGSAPRFSFDLWKDIPRAIWNQWVAHGSQRVLPPGKALRMVTIDAARALGIGDHVGSLEAGKKADVILLDFNRPHLTPQAFVPQLLTYYVNGNDVDTVLVDGQILMEGGRILSVDVQEIIDQAKQEAERAFTHVDLEPYLQMGSDFWHSARY